MTVSTEIDQTMDAVFAASFDKSLFQRDAFQYQRHISENSSLLMRFFSPQKSQGLQRIFVEDDLNSLYTHMYGTRDFFSAEKYSDEDFSMVYYNLFGKFPNFIKEYIDWFGEMLFWKHHEDNCNTCGNRLNEFEKIVSICNPCTQQVEEISI